MKTAQVQVNSLCNLRLIVRDINEYSVIEWHTRDANIHSMYTILHMEHCMSLIIDANSSPAQPLKVFFSESA